jgi:flagellar basal-body rod modification protein FlgD
MAGLWNTVEVGKSVKGYDLGELSNPGSKTVRKVTSTVDGQNKVLSEGDQELFKEANNLGKDDFLNLLVTQLRFQDPMSPKADTEFVAQLAQFSSLETNKNVETSMTSLAENMNDFMNAQTLNSASTVNAASTNLLGKEVRVAVNDFRLTAGNAQVPVQLDEGVKNAYAAVKNAQGDVLAYQRIDIIAGSADAEFSWDGLTSDGITAPNGTYQIEILDATKLNVVGHAYTEGSVTGLRYGSTGSRIQIGEQSFALKDLLSVNS